MYVRKISCNELLYLDMQDLTNTYATRYIFKIKKIESIKFLEGAVNEVIKQSIGTNVFLKGKKYYTVDKKIVIKEVTDNSNDFYNISLFNEKIDYNKESILAYIINNNKDKYLVFFISHAIMDGKGGLLFVKNIINYLNNEKLIKCYNTETEKSFIKNLNYISKSESKIPKLKCKYSKRVNEYIPRMKVIEIDKYIVSIVSKLAFILAKEFLNDEVKFMIPTDLRRHDRKNNYIGNLTLPIFLNVKDTDTYQKINGQLLTKIKEKKELNMKNASYYAYLHMPKFLRKLILKVCLKTANISNKFCVASLISHVGRIKLEDYQSEKLKLENFVSFPVQEPLGAFGIVITECGNKTMVALSYYEGQFDNEYINNLCKKIKKYLTEEG